MVTVTLFTKTGCGLCEEIKTHLAQFQAHYPHELQEIDITQDDALLKRYHDTIPVVRIGEQELAAPITVDQLQNALQEASL